MPNRSLSESDGNRPLTETGGPKRLNYRRVLTEFLTLKTLQNSPVTCILAGAKYLARLQLGNITIYGRKICGGKCWGIFQTRKSPTFSDWAKSLKNMVGTE